MDTESPICDEYSATIGTKYQASSYSLHDKVLGEEMMENKITQLRKGILELAILGALSRGAHYGYSLGRVLAGNDTIDLKEGTIYPLLSRLAKENLVRTRWVESREGPPRKYYELTIEGERVFRALIEEFHRLESLVERSLRPIDDGASTPYIGIEFPPSRQVSVPFVTATDDRMSVPLVTEVGVPYHPIPGDHTGTPSGTPGKDEEIPKEDKNES